MNGCLKNLTWFYLPIPSYKDLPGVWILLGLGVWIGHFSLFNQYITQRALAAKDVKEAQKGVMFAAYLKLLMPVVIVLPEYALQFISNA